ncbi:Toprim domain-containing protein [Paracandidimonas soli]|uniref:Toprim domain-containing protein n=2 Tax=Paracandidimonas soli TaxID=1917182 RepID=A0A4R3VAD9_9BURK|nr:Toprim domain-containing protein [Paracandidimonas soli]
MSMSPDLLTDALAHLAEFEFKERGGWLRQGRCPSCSRKELYTKADAPWVVRCGRLNNCGYEIHIKELYPQLFEQWSSRYPSTPKNPNAAAEAYLSIHRGFDISKIRGCYTQETYFDQKLNAGTATVRFQIGDTWWERLIDQPGRFGKKARFKYGGSYQGQWWVPPGVHPLNSQKLWLVEGIFDAIALMHHGIDALSLMSCNNYPEKALAELKANRPTGSTLPVLVWALDGNEAGRRYIRKWKARAESEGWLCQAAVIPQRGRTQQDWSDLHLLDRAQEDPEKLHLSQEGLKRYLHEGALLTAKTASEKGLLIYNNSNNHTEFEFAHSNRLYWFKLDVDKYQHALNRIGEENGGLSDDELRERALNESNSIREIANCLPVPLYFQENRITDESWYYFRVTFPHDGKPVKNTFTSSQVSTASEFKKRLLGIAPGAVYTGSNQQLERSMKNQLFNIKRVETVDFIGYSRDLSCYVLGDVAMKDGSLYTLNNEDYFDIGQLSVKSLNQSVELKINSQPHEYQTEWVSQIYEAFGSKGLAALAFWFGTLFCEQIRQAQDSYPFMEIVGEAGAGKSTLIEFLWKLFGRSHYEGFDPSKSTNAGRARNFSQVSGLPVVLIESDREVTGEGKSHVKTFDWDELKTAYNGRSIRSRGMATGGNETYEPPFRGAIVISQNNQVSGSEAIMTRIMHLYFDRAGQSATTKAAANKLSRTDVACVSGFILAATKREAAVMAILNEKAPIYENWLLENPDIRTVRIAKNHGQLMALADALRLVIKITDEQHAELHEQIVRMAVERQMATNSDHPLVIDFWDMYEFLNGDDDIEPRLNHSRNPEREIAINFNHFVMVAADHRQQVPPLRDLKNLLKTSRRYRYDGQRVVNSAIHARNINHKGSTSERCWIFLKEAP